MSKTHIINLNIINNTPFDFIYSDDYFQTGKLASDSWPQVIQSGSSAQAQCCETDFSFVGCSGWVKYATKQGTVMGKDLFFCFSNPVAGTNGIAIGLDNSAWNSMTGEYDNGLIVPLCVNNDNLWFSAHITSTSGDENQATWTVRLIDLNVPVLENIKMDDVVTAFKNISNQGSRVYYRCDSLPIGFSSMAESHLKGISVFGDKVIFSQPDITLIPDPQGNGKYVIADQITVGNQGMTDLTAQTGHPGWVHPCSSQACGSFMAQGLQETAKNPSNTSEIDIFDIRNAQINQPIKLLGKIQRPDDGVNGLAMTRELSGTYLVAAVNGNHLKVYRSSTTDLLGTFPDFSVVIEDTAFPESGSGLALITQKNGDIFLVALNAEDDCSNNHIALFKLDFDNKAVILQDSKDMPVTDISDTVTLLQEYSVAIAAYSPLLAATIIGLIGTFGYKYLNSCFRWGKGLRIKDCLNFEVYASDRNIFPLSDIPVIGSNKDFSMISWSTNQTQWLKSGLTVKLSTTNLDYLTVAKDDGTPTADLAIRLTQTTVGPFEKFTIIPFDRATGVFSLLTCNGYYLTINNGGGTGTDSDNLAIHTNQKTAGENDTFTIEEQSDGTYALKTKNGHYLTAVNGGGISAPHQAISSDLRDQKNDGYTLLGLHAG